MLHDIIPHLVTRLLSIWQASSLRERYYQQAERIEILETALEDIHRISSSRADISERHRLIVGIVEHTVIKKP